MKKITFQLYLMVIIVLTTTSLTAQNNEFKFEGEKHLSNFRMLTVAGENAEAYLSFDEKELIFQSTHVELKCDQIFTMSIEGSNKQMVSDGKGRTTCSSAILSQMSSTSLIRSDKLKS